MRRRGTSGDVHWSGRRYGSRRLPRSEIGVVSLGLRTPNHRPRKTTITLRALRPRRRFRQTGPGSRIFTGILTSASDVSESGARGCASSARAPGICVVRVGCMFGRYSLDEPGLILADQGATCRTTWRRCRAHFAPDRTTSSQSWMVTGSRTTSLHASDSSSAHLRRASTSRRTFGSSPSPSV